MIHCRLAAVTCSSAWMDGRATLTMLKSSCRTNCAAQISASGQPAARRAPPGTELVRGLAHVRLLIAASSRSGRRRLRVLACAGWTGQGQAGGADVLAAVPRSEEHTSEIQSLRHL